MRRGWTLVELVVTLAVIAVILGLLLPTIAKARRAAIATACQNNLRVIGQSMAKYAIANNGWCFPPFTDYVMLVGSEWPDVLVGPRPEATVVCATGIGLEDVSYVLNGWIPYLRIKSGHAGRRSSAQIVVAGEQLIGHRFYYMHPDLYPGIVDSQRHGASLRSNYLWLDFHVDNRGPTAFQGAHDPWWIPN